MQDILRWIASIMTIGSGFVIAIRVRPVLMGWAFVGLTIGSLTWIIAGYLVPDYPLVAQRRHYLDQLRRHLSLADLEGKNLTREIIAHAA